MGSNGGIVAWPKWATGSADARDAVVITFILLLIMLFVLHKTQFGRHVYAIGGNREASAARRGSRQPACDRPIHTFGDYRRNSRRLEYGALFGRFFHRR